MLSSAVQTPFLKSPLPAEPSHMSAQRGPHVLSDVMCFRYPKFGGNHSMIDIVGQLRQAELHP